MSCVFDWSEWAHAGPVAVESAPAAPVGVVPWLPGVAVAVLPTAYRDLVEVLVDAGHPLRAAQVAAAAGVSTDKSKVEGLRAKLKRPEEQVAVRFGRR
jgi:hypothetical protein